jgi:hypothetical protein
MVASPRAEEHWKASNFGCSGQTQNSWSVSTRSVSGDRKASPQLATGKPMNQLAKNRDFTNNEGRKAQWRP